MEEMLIRYGIFSAILIIPAFFIIMHIKKQQEENQNTPTNKVRTENRGARIIVGIFAAILGIVILTIGYMHFIEMSDLAKNGTEVTLTINECTNVTKQRSRNHRGSSSYTEYYRANYIYEGTEYRTSFSLSSNDEEPEFETGDQTKGVVDNPTNPSQTEAPANKASLALKTKIETGILLLFGLLSIAGSIRVLTRKPYRLLKSDNGKWEWKM